MKTILQDMDLKNPVWLQGYKDRKGHGKVRGTGQGQGKEYG